MTMQQTQQTGNQERSERREAAQATSKRARRQAARRARLTHRRRAKAQPLPRPTERHPHRVRTFSHARRVGKARGAQGESAHAVGGSRGVGRPHISSNTLARGVMQARTAPATIVAHKGRAQQHTAGAPNTPRTTDETYIKAGENRNDNNSYVHR